MKHIVVSGCSFTHNARVNMETERQWINEDIKDWTWAHWLQYELKETHTIHNYGTITTVNGVELPCHNQNAETILKQVLEHLGYKVEIVSSDDVE
mgnify:CR=1 FL=1